MSRLNGEKTGRDESGRFVAGAPGGPGRPRRQTERNYLQVLSEVCGPDAWREIVERAVSDAKSGDERARSWLAGYLLGRPETAARTLHQLAVEAEADSDPVASDARLERMINPRL